MLVRRRLRSIGRDNRAVALIEFALALPLFLVAVLFGIEFANFCVVHMKMSQIAALVADNAARVRDSIDEADINEIMLGAKLYSGGYNVTTNGRIILSSVERNSKGGMYIRWQRCKGLKNWTSSYGVEGSGNNVATPTAIGPAGNQIMAIDGAPIMFVELSYDYTPIFSGKLIPNKTIKYTFAYTVRQRVDQVLKRASTATPQALCSVFSS